MMTFIRHKKEISEEEARLKMAELCARSEQCVFDIREKLFRIGVSEEVRRRIIDYLEENRFIDEERYARSYSRDKLRFSGWGPFKIRQGLFAKRIPRDIISEAIDELDENEIEEAIERVTMSKSRSLDLLGEKARENRLKLYRFLLGRGFAIDDSKEAVKMAARVQREKRE